MKKGRVTIGLNDFEFCASLHLLHLSLDPDEVTAELNLTPDRTHRAGDARVTPKGTPLDGNYSEGYWRAELEVKQDEQLTEFLERIAKDLSLAKPFLRRLYESGGRIECFVDLFAYSLCDQVYPAALLHKLGELGIDLRLDFYKKDVSESEESCGS
jgi:hypothetical protein